MKKTGSHRSRSGSNLKENRTPEVVISESDLEAGVAYLKSLPWSATENMPEPWSRQRLLNSIADAISAQKKIKAGDILKITHGIWAVVKPIGIDVAGDPFAHDKRLQVWLLIRYAGTNPDKFIEVETE